MNNAHYTQILREVTQLLEIAGENKFRIRAFDNATRAVENITEPIDQLIAKDILTDIPGIGTSIANDLKEIHETGTCSLHTDLLNRLDPGLLQLLRIQGLGPKRVKALYDSLGIKTLDDLAQAATSNQIQSLSGFGKKTEEKILVEIERLKQDSGRIPMPQALITAENLREQLAELPDVQRVEIAGSLRRGRETIGDIDLLVASDKPVAISDFFVSLKEVGDVLAHGETKTSVRLKNGMQVDLRVVNNDVFGSALHYFTGSKGHHIALRMRAKKNGLKISEYGVFNVANNHLIASRTEEDVFNALNLAYIPPELREGHGEIEAAENNALPQLIEHADVRGDLHLHTTETDGQNSIMEMAQAAKAMGYDYIAVTDHSQAVSVANGMTPERFRRHIEHIRVADAEIDDFRILSGIEVDILKAGELDMDHDLLAQCDWVVGSIHSHFSLGQEQMTKRIIAAIETGLISTLGHPTGRILGGRPGYQYDIDAVFEAAAHHGVALEINGSTGRLDLNAELARKAHAHGALITFGSDAHSIRGLEDMRFSVIQARRAWLEAKDVLNTYSVEKLLQSVRPAL